MAYTKQFFEADDLISSTDITQISTNIEEVRTQHKLSSEPPEIFDGVLWLDDNSNPWKWKVYAGDEWVTFATINPDEEEGWGANQEYATNPSAPLIEATDFFGTSVVTEEQWESVGPTGSGADNIWTALDSVPISAQWIELRIVAQASSAGGAVLDIYTRAFGSSQSVAAANKILGLSQQAASVLNHDAYTNMNTKMQVDASTRFEVYWNKNVADSVGWRFFLAGYGFNR